MDTRLKLFRHTHTDHNRDQTLFLLHGTGGTMHDFMFLDLSLQERYNVVGIQGNINENGMNRFFLRHAAGVFDQQSIQEEAEKLASFIAGWIQTHPTHRGKLVFLGYSNGANMLLAMLFIYPELMKHLILLHPMLPFTPETPLDLSAHQVFVSIGRKDKMIPPARGQEVVTLLKSYGAKVKVAKYPGGHEVRPNEIKDVIDFIGK